jgi:hypothetical protein
VSFVLLFLKKLNSKIKNKKLKNPNNQILFEQGNKEYQKKLNDDAIDSYTQALQYANTNSEEMALAFANRWFKKRYLLTNSY